MGRREIPSSTQNTVDTATVSTQVVNQVQNEFVVYGCDRLNLRKKPTLTAPVVDILTAGTRLIGEGYSEEWVKVSTMTGNILSGYVLREFIKEV